MNILLIGSSGFVGTNVRKKLEHKHTIIKFDLSHGLDMGVWTDVEKMSRNADAIFHFGAVAVGRRNFDKKPQMAKLEYIGVRNLVRAAEIFRIPLVFASSIRVYGTTEEMQRGEDDGTHPTNLYGQMKLDCENIIKNSAACWTILRMAATYGKGMSEDFIIPLCYRSIMRGEPITLTSNGQQKRNFLFINDLVQCIALLIDRAVYANEIINIANHETVDLFELIKLLGAVVGKKTDVQPAHVGNKDPNEFISIKKVEKLLGWRAETSLLSGLGQCYAHEFF